MQTELTCHLEQTGYEDGNWM